MRKSAPDATPRTPKKLAHVEPVCLGCGVCALKCPTGALKLHPRPQKVFHPEDSFERVMLQALERDTFQTFIFDNPASRTQEFMRALVGGFLKLPPGQARPFEREAALALPVGIAEGGGLGSSIKAIEARQRQELSSRCTRDIDGERPKRLKPPRGTAS
jgi:ferredoxin